jgi:CHAT domain
LPYDRQAKVNVIRKEDARIGKKLGNPHFKFSGNRVDDWLAPNDLSTKSILFGSKPLVILNACETGTFGTDPMDDSGFVGRFIQSGASAVIVTESPVLNNFTFHFCEFLIGELFNKKNVKKMDVSEALFNTRRHFLNEMNNPLGLAYALYGNLVIKNNPGNAL